MELKKKDDGCWHVGFQTDHGYKWKNTKATSREEADAIVATAKIAEIELLAKSSSLTSEVLSSIMTGRKVVVSQVLAEWVEWRKINKSANTVQAQAYQVAKFINTNRLGRMMVNQINESHVDAYVNPTDNLSASSRKCRLAAVQSFLGFAKSKAYMLHDPAGLVEVNYRQLTHGQKEGKRRIPFTEEEYKKVIASTRGFWKYATAISYWAGLRLSDCANLEWGCISETEIVTWTRKRNARVALPISDPLIGGGDLGLIILEMMDTIPRIKKSPRIFPSEADEVNDPCQSSHLSTRYARLLAKAGITDKTFHCLRHSFATRLSKAGKTEEEIGRLIGHASTETTKGYIH